VGLEGINRHFQQAIGVLEVDGTVLKKTAGEPKVDRFGGQQDTTKGRLWAGELSMRVDFREIFGRSPNVERTEDKNLFQEPHERTRRTGRSYPGGEVSPGEPAGGAQNIVDVGKGVDNDRDFALGIARMSQQT
jgi:hypothetical protein